MEAEEKMRRLLISVSLLLAAVTILATSQMAYLALPSFQGEGSSFRYTGQGQRNGSIYVNLSVDFDHAAALQKHVQVNKDRARELASHKGPIPVVVTFAQPLPQADAIALGQAAGLKVDSFLVAGRSPISGKRGTRIEFGTLDKASPTEIDMSRGQQEEKISIQGVMVVKGSVDNPSGLLKLVSDPRVYLADSSEFEVRQLIAQHHAAVAAGKEVAVTTESPYWRLNW
jgi:hypothetical protein